MIDPIDGSLNAKRGLTHHAISIAVADGPTMADVAFGYVYDFGPGEEWRARRGEGAFLNGEPLRPAARAPQRRRPAGARRSRVGRPALARRVGRRCSSTSHRVRAIGSIAISLCQVAAARVDGMATLWKRRAVDAAAAPADRARDAAAYVAFPGFDDPLGAPLDLEPHSPVVAARTAASAGASCRPCHVVD